jgi:hypothetical protein
LRLLDWNPTNHETRRGGNQPKGLERHPYAARPRKTRGSRARRGDSDAASEVHHVTILDDVVLPREVLEVAGLGLAGVAGGVEVVEGGDLGDNRVLDLTAA